ncbi:NADPH:quinone oxidoreductase family protein [Sphingomonas mali]|uniref:NADPH:quinone oxidoreductase family protein n=1 Tax=Sphingomonas mali TaxID=40682 RepID=UPI0034E27612
MVRALLVRALTSDLSGTGLAMVERPVPAPASVTVRVRAASLNFPDLLMTRGEYQLKPPLPFVPGMDFAGDVMDADPATGWTRGDAVAGSLRYGALAQEVAADAASLRRKPVGISYAQAAAIGTTYLTAYVALVRLAAIAAGQTLLVHGASGGVGTAAVDLGTTLGARVIAASGSPDKLARIAEVYAPFATLDTSQPFREAVRALSGGGADIVFDPVGGAIFDESVRCVAFGGKLLVVGFASGRIPSLAMNIPLIKGFSVIGVRAGEYGRRFPALGAANRDAIWALAGAGRINPLVHAVVPLEQWREAFAMMSDRRLVGKVVIALPD